MQTVENKLIDPGPELKVEDLLKFINDFKGKNAYKGYCEALVASDVLKHLYDRTCYHYNEGNRFTYFVSWTYTGVDSLHINQVICRNSRAFKMLTERIRYDFGDCFEITYDRRGKKHSVKCNEDFAFRVFGLKRTVKN